MSRLIPVFLVLLSIVTLAALFIRLQPEAAVTPPAPQEIARQIPETHIEHGKRVAGPAVIRVRQGDTLEVQFVSDHDSESHLHGYDRHLALKAGEPATLTLQAEHAGRFEYELHGHGDGGHSALGVIEVQPR